MAVRKVVAADFATCWAKYMNDGIGTAFNKSSSDILRKMPKGADAITRDVFKKYAKMDASAVSSATNVVDPAVKVAIGCLNAIRSFPSTADDEGNEPLRWVLAGADQVGLDLSTKARTPEEEALLTEELRQLFTLKVDPALLHPSTSPPTSTSASPPLPTSVTSSYSASGGPRSAQDIMASYALRSEEEMEVESSGNGSGCGNGSAVPQDPKRVVKTTASLTLAAFRVFPFLTSLRVGPEAVNNFLSTLTSTGAWASAISVMQQYPAQTSVESFEWLFLVLTTNAEWERLTELTLAVRTLLHTNITATNTTTTISGSSTSASGGSSSGVDIVGSGGPYLIQMSPEDLKQRVIALIQLCLDANTTVSLNAAKKLATAYKLREQTEMIQEAEQTLKFTAAITKGKWQIFVQQLERGGMPKKVKFYNMMVQHGKYIEAAETYRSLRLHGSNAVPVTRAQLEAQAVYNRETYLAFPAALMDNVLIIRDQRSLEQAAREMGLSLHPAPPVTPPSTTTTSAASPTTSTTNASTTNSASSAKGEKEAVRSVTFQSLINELPSTHSTHSTYKHTIPIKGPYKYLNGQYRLVVGLDGEWRACVQRDLSGMGCSILQIATPDKVYIVDFRTLCPERLNGDFRPNSAVSSPRGKAPFSPLPTPPSGHGSVNSSVPAIQSHITLKDQTHNLLKHLFSDPTVLKVGWDFLSEDIRMLRRNSNGAFVGSVAELHSYIETKDVGERLLYQEMSKSRDSSQGADEEAARAKKVASLSSACAEFLSRPLLKLEQMSNWDQRPLSHAQVQYAALDAHATLSLLDAFLQRAGVPLPARLGIADRYYLSPVSTSATASAGRPGAARYGAVPQFSGKR